MRRPGLKQIINLLRNKSMKKIILMLAAVTIAASAAMAQQAIFDPTKKKAVAKTEKCDRKVELKKAECKTVDCKATNCANTECAKANCANTECAKANCANTECAKANCTNTKCAKANCANTKCAKANCAKVNCEKKVCDKTVECKQLNRDSENSKPRSGNVKKVSKSENLQKVATKQDANNGKPAKQIKPAKKK